MAKTIKIPEGYDPLEIMVNNCLYVYKPGETVTVPDDVASAIESMIDLNPEASPEVKLETISYDPVKDVGKALVVQEDGSLKWSTVESGSGSGLPEISAGDAGKVLTVNEGETGAEWASSGGALFVNVNATFDEEDEEELVSLVLDKTWAEINGALRAGTAVFFASVNEGFINGFTLAGLNASEIGLLDSNGYAYDLSVSSENDYPEYTANPS